MRERLVTTKDAEEVPLLVRKHGVAIWRGLVPAEVTEQLIEPTLEGLRDARNYASVRYGVLRMDILPEELQRKCITPDIRQVFDNAIEGNEITIQEIYATRKDVYQPHPWHQDANEGNREYHFMCWIAVTHCGDTSPGLSFAIGNPGEYIGDGIKERVRKSEILSPVFKPGDAFFFDVFSIHKTRVHGNMRLDRIAYKLGTRLPSSPTQTPSP